VKNWTDQQLLRDYAGHRTETAFAELVRRHVDLVHSAARRIVGDAHLAEDVTQGVFVAFARSAGQLLDRPVLSGWLHRTAQNIAAQTVRTEVRRRARESEAAVMNELSDHDARVWEHLAPHLDAALAGLGEPDRDALMLRYFERKSAREMAQTLAISAEAAQKRVNRAVERLRGQFAKHGVAVGAGGMVVVLSANAVQAAPAGLAASIASAATLAGTTLATTATLKTTAMTTLQKTVVTVALTASVGTGLFEARQAAALRTQIHTLQQATPQVEPLEQWQREQRDLTRKLAALRAENQRLNRTAAELLKLRAEVTLLRDQKSPLVTVGIPAGTPETGTNDGPSAEDVGRALGQSVVRGDPGAMHKVRDLANAEYAGFNTNSAGLTDGQRDDLARQTFAPLNAAFAVITDAAVKGNASALEAVVQALQIPELQGQGIQTLGTLAGNGNPDALNALLNYQQYGLMLSGAVGALQPAAASGNPKAIAFLASVAQDSSQQPLWFMVADALTPAAVSGDSQAIDTLISLSGGTNVSVQNAAVAGLRQAAAHQNPKAVNALHTLGLPTLSL
jgi:RNA polymerase sigma factor (sigma-70 family)